MAWHYPRLLRLRQAISRYYTIFDPGYVNLVTPWVASGDFEIELDMVIDSVAGTDPLVSGTNQSSNAIIIDVQSSGMVRAFAFIGNALQAIITSTSTVDDGLSHNIKLSYSGTTAELFIDGIAEGAEVWLLDGGQDVSYFATRASVTNSFAGIIYNVSLKDLDNPSNSRYYPLDTDSLTIARETFNVDGAELYVDGGTLNNWLAPRTNATLSVAGNYISARAQTPSTHGAAYELTGLTVGKAYKLKQRITSDIGEAQLFIRFLDNTSLTGTNLASSTNGSTELEFEGIAVATATTMYFGFLSTAAGSIKTVTVDEFSIKETTDALYIDVQSEDKIQELP